MHSAKIICDSLSPDGVRLTTFEVTMPRIVLAELNTHRMFSRSSASSRAIPVEKMLKMVRDTPYIPGHWGKNQKGMVADKELDEFEQAKACLAWMAARNDAVRHAERLLEIGVHKQITNRLLEPFLFHTVVVTATEWSNFFNLRCHKDAHPDIRKVALLMLEQYNTYKPAKLGYGQWHLPYLTLEEIADLHMQKIDAYKISAARCAAVSYMRQGERDIPKELARYEQLLSGGHMSPLEHPARPMTEEEIDKWAVAELGGIPFLGNLCGWVQHRKEIPDEEDRLCLPLGG